jgi:LytS/YehU family sensor histidine kinase
VYWVGRLWACLISLVLWHGNRYFLLKQRQHFDWFQHPVRKLVALVFASVFYTAPCTVLMMLAWYQYAALPADWPVIRTVTLACVVCVLFITHMYETVYLIHQRESDLVAVERLERARTEAELDALKVQVAPHFLFNSLNTLSWLIENSPQKAVEFNQSLAEVYRYILAGRRRELVPLQEEIDFSQQYFSLLRIRFENSLELRIAGTDGRTLNWYVPPISMQVLLENAVKHNEHSRQHPLTIDVTFAEGTVEVANEIRPRITRPHAAGIGLKSLDERCRLVLGSGLTVSDESGRFRVLLPVKES